VIPIRKFVAALLLLILFSESATAASKITLKTADFSISYNAGSSDQVTSGILSGNSLIVGSTIDNQSNGYSTANISSYSFDGSKQWDLPLTGEGISGQLAKDKLGNIYLLGAIVSPSSTQPNVPITNSPTDINPDNVQVDPVTTPNNSLTTLNVWKVSNTGQLLQTFQLPINEPISPKSISSSTNGFLITGMTPKRYFQVSMDIDGVFGSITTIKTPKTSDLIGEFKSGSNKLKFFLASKSIVGVPTWKPKKPTPVLIQYSKLGTVKAANYFQGSPVFLLYQANLGVIVGSESTTGFGISIVKPLI
jgi:hypothetical protein